jgi:hypothetical protein
VIQARPLPPILEIGGIRWRSAQAGDAAVLDRLAALNAHRTLFNLPVSQEDFARRVDRPGFRLAMICSRAAEPMGAAAISMRNNRSLNVRLICFFAEPATATLALAAYVRHVFWTLPMHRIYAQLPMVPEAVAYGRLLTAAGFEEEGVVRAHALVAGRACDVAAYGLLRSDFEAWCEKNQSPLAL